MGGMLEKNLLQRSQYAPHRRLNLIGIIGHAKATVKQPCGQQALLQTATIGVPPFRSNSAGEEQHDDNDQEDSAEADAGMTKTIAVPAEAATETTEQVNDKDDNEDGSERHSYCSFYLTTATLLALAES
jgi:hypothetical protein